MASQASCCPYSLVCMGPNLHGAGPGSSSHLRWTRSSHLFPNPPSRVGPQPWHRAGLVLGSSSHPAAQPPRGWDPCSIVCMVLLGPASTPSGMVLPQAFCAAPCPHWTKVPLPCLPNLHLGALSNQIQQLPTPRPSQACLPARLPNHILHQPVSTAKEHSKSTQYTKHGCTPARSRMSLP